MTYKNCSSARVCYIQYTNAAAYPPLEHSSRLLANSGWEILFLGTGAYGADALEFPPHPRVRVLRLPFCQPGWRQKLHYLRYCLWVLLWTLCWRPRWLYASDPLVCPAAMLPSLVPGVRLLYHEHDSPPAETSAGRFLRLVLAARRVIARRSALCVLPNEARMKRFADEIGGQVRVVCVWNCPSLAEIGPPRAPHEGGDLWLLYHGSIVPSRLPLTVVDALNLLPDRVKLRIVGYETVGHPGYVRELLNHAAELGIPNRLHIVGSVPNRVDLLDWADQADAGLALLPFKSHDANEQTMAGASNKPFDYLARGLPLIVSALPDWEALFVQAGYGWSCDPSDPVSIATAIQRYLDDPNLMRAMGEQGRQRIASEWNYERQFSKVGLTCSGLPPRLA